MSTPSIVERVAKAIFRSEFAPSEDEAAVALKWEEWGLGQRRRSFAAARAAIGAMREPTDSMSSSGADHLQSIGFPGDDEDFVLIWQRALDAALAEPNQP